MFACCATRADDSEYDSYFSAVDRTKVYALWTDEKCRRLGRDSIRRSMWNCHPVADPGALKFLTFDQELEHRRRLKPYGGSNELPKLQKRGILILNR